MTSVTVVGLGAMGAPIARNLLAAGYQVTVWNRTPAATQDLVAAGARAVDSLDEAFATGTVLSMLANDPAVRERLLVDDLLAGAPAGAVHVNLATVSVDLAREATAAHARHGVGYVAAPVFGRVEVAAAGRLNIIAAGDPALLDRLRPVFDVIGQRTWLFGDEPHRANTVKIVGNYLIACAIQSLAEALSLARGAGIDESAMVDLLSNTLFTGPVYAGYGGLIARQAYEPAGFSARLGLKDVGLALDAGRAADIPLPIGGVLRDAFLDALAHGQSEQDWASIAEVQRRRANQD
jgi:3-hydroxyisobutyrate dehydrogenase-like beta-hydroxyacid dehydrogenase